MTSQLTKDKNPGILAIHPESFSFLQWHCYLTLSKPRTQMGVSGQIQVFGQTAESSGPPRGRGETATPASTLGFHSQHLNILTTKLPPALESSLMEVLAVLCCP